MQWYEVKKTIKGRSYRYRQRTYRVAGKVKTESRYLGPVDGPKSGRVPVRDREGEQARDVAITDRTTPREVDVPPAPSLRMDKYTRWREDISQQALHHEIDRVEAQMTETGVNTTNLKPVRLHHGRKVRQVERDDGHYVYGPADEQRVAFKRAYRRALADRWITALRDEQPERYQLLCQRISHDFSLTCSGVRPQWLALLGDWWHQHRQGHREAVEVLAEMLQRGRVETQAKYYLESGRAEDATIKAWAKFERLTQPAARQRQFAECQRLERIFKEQSEKHGVSIWVRAYVFDERPILSDEEIKSAKKKFRSKKITKKRSPRYRRRRYPRWSR